MLPSPLISVIMLASCQSEHKHKSRNVFVLLPLLIKFSLDFLQNILQALVEFGILDDTGFQNFFLGLEEEYRGFLNLGLS